MTAPASATAPRDLAVRDAGDDIDDLQRLLNGAETDPPYVLVAQPDRGILMRLFADAYPQQTAGIVLLDAKGRDQMRRELAIWPKSQAPAMRRSRPSWYGVASISPLARSPAASHASVRTPLAVITAGTHDADWS